MTELPFVYITTETAYAVVSDAAAKRGMSVAEYVSLAISRQINEDSGVGRTDSVTEDTICDS